jgi:RNA polymerase sigma factor (sigma-70 family)
MAVSEPAPRMVAEPGGDDHRLVAAVRRGDDRAFELLYERYHRRIHAYVMGMVKDHGRAEDVTQEVFVSALRRMRETERPIAFKPWIYEIARNACIDQFRRSSRAQEISLDADEGLGPSDYLVGSEPTPDAALAAKQDLDNLRGAFIGLSDTHHEILVMRELAGMSYHEIGERLGMSRPAVESTLFRARRRLSEEYDDLATGARCQRIHGLIQTAASGRIGTRDERRLSRHVAHCQPCRREAIVAGLDESLLTHVPLPTRAARKIAGLLPFPLFGRGRGGDTGWMAPLVSEQAAGGWGKLATAAAVVVAGIGASGVGDHVTGSDATTRERDRPAQAQAATATQRAPAKQAKPASRGAAPATGAERSGTESRRPGREPARSDRRDAGAGSTGGGATVPAADTGGQPSGGGGTGSGALPSVGVPSGGEPARPVRETVESVGRTVQPVTDTVDKTVNGATETVTDTAGNATEPVTGVTDPVTDTVDGATAPVQETVDGAVETVENTTGTDLPLP